MACNTQGPPLLQPAEILHLPPSVRRRIYDHVGLVLGQGNEVLDLNRKSGITTLGFQGLLLSCRTIYEEASNVLYSSNRFVVRYSRSGSLRCLQNLNVGSVKALRRLKVILAETSCHFPVTQSYGECCVDNGECHACHDHDAPLDGNADALLTEWKSTVNYLASVVEPGKLSLSIVCDVLPTFAGIQIAKSAAAPLLSFSRLESCFLRWCQSVHPELQELAQQIVLQTCRVTPLPLSRPTSLLKMPSTSNPLVSSGLASLPRELRLAILEYTDLVTPWTEVTWSRQSKAFSMRSTYCEDRAGQGFECPPARHHGCHFVECWHAWGSIEPTTPGCFCRAVHSAYSWPATCGCWASPQALFLVCRTICLDAQAVFFNKNRFVVHDFYADPPYKFQKTPSFSGPDGRLRTDWGDYPFSRFAASIFLQKVVPSHCLGHLRFLEMVFPPYWPESWPQESDDAVEDWTATLDWARGQLNTSLLTIRVVMTDVNVCETLPRLYFLEGEGEAIIAGYMCIISNLARLGPLHKFYAQLVSPWRWIKYRVGNKAAVVHKERELKEQAERLLMGSRYESLHSGTAEPPASMWQRVYCVEGRHLFHI